MLQTATTVNMVILPNAYILFSHSLDHKRRGAVETKTTFRCASPPLRGLQAIFRKK